MIKDSFMLEPEVQQELLNKVQALADFCTEHKIPTIVSVMLALNHKEHTGHMQNLIVLRDGELAPPQDLLAKMLQMNGDELQRIELHLKLSEIIEAMVEREGSMVQ